MITRGGRPITLERVVRHAEWRLNSAKRTGRLAIGGADSRRELQRRTYHALAKRFTPTLEVDSGGSRLLIKTSDLAIGLEAFIFGSFDREMMQSATTAMEKHLGPSPIAGKVFLDIGANIGTTSL